MCIAFSFLENTWYWNQSVMIRIFVFQFVFFFLSAIKYWLRPFCLLSKISPFFWAVSVKEKALMCSVSICVSIPVFYPMPAFLCRSLFCFVVQTSGFKLNSSNAQWPKKAGKGNTFLKINKKWINKRQLSTSAWWPYKAFKSRSGNSQT